MHHLDKNQIKALIQAIKDPKEKLMTKVAYNHGLRASEVVNLTGKDIRDGFVIVQRLKGSEKTIQPYVSSPDPDLDEAVELAILSDTLKPKDRLFPGVSRFNFNYRIKAAGKKAGIPAHLAHPHALKHSCAISIIPGGIEYTRKYLGHKSLSSTGEYLKVSDEKASAIAHLYLGK